MGFNEGVHPGESVFSDFHYLDLRQNLNKKIHNFDFIQALYYKVSFEFNFQKHIYVHFSFIESSARLKFFSVINAKISLNMS